MSKSQLNQSFHELTDFVIPSNGIDFLNNGHRYLQHIIEVDRQYSGNNFDSSYALINHDYINYIEWLNNRIDSPFHHEIRNLIEEIRSTSADHFARKQRYIARLSQDADIVE